MTIVFEFLNYILEQRNEILTLLIQHIRLTVFSVLLAIVLGVPLGILVKYVQKLNKPILGFANIVQAIPSMALLGIAIPLLGIGSAPAIAHGNTLFTSAYNKKYIHWSFKHKPANNGSC